MASKDLVSARVLLTVLTAVSIAILVLVIIPRDEFGDVLIRNPTPRSAALLEATKLTLESYGDLIQLLSASFAVVPFVIGYQSQRRAHVPAAAWFRLSVGVLLLGTALLLALLGRERILTMVARDAVNLGADNLLYLRWASYTSFTLAAVLVSSFAVSAFNAEVTPPLPPLDEEG
jgi:hypothetical protein